MTLTAVRNIHSKETLIEMLRSRVGSHVSTLSLAHDLQKSANTTHARGINHLKDIIAVVQNNELSSDQPDARNIPPISSDHGPFQLVWLSDSNLP
ncbi:MAG: hypothetical protein OXE78_04600 [Gammaproteobacteria bacterium]|nr:hypothetical protein [Gammaproteobacteria bacterium]MCY4356318.1 hypothetical protein [Gammaproteobacteria bacterium]